MDLQRTLIYEANLILLLTREKKKKFKQLNSIAPTFGSRCFCCLSGSGLGDAGVWGAALSSQGRSGGRASLQACASRVVPESVFPRQWPPWVQERGFIRGSVEETTQCSGRRNWLFRTCSRGDVGSSGTCPRTSPSGFRPCTHLISTWF